MITMNNIQFKLNELNSARKLALANI